MKTKLLRKLRRRALRKVKFIHFQSYVVIAEVSWWCGGRFLPRKHYTCYTLQDFSLFSVEQLKKALRYARSSYIMDALKEIKDSRQTKSRTKKIEQLNRIK